MNSKYLPIGTVVLLKNGNKKVMITSYLVFSTGNNSEEKKMYDYGSCTFPEGIIDSNYAVGFNHDDIEKIIHLGLIDDDQKQFNELLNQTTEDIHKKFEEELNKKTEA